MVPLFQSVSIKQKKVVELAALYRETWPRHDARRLSARACRGRAACLTSLGGEIEGRLCCASASVEFVVTTRCAPKRTCLTASLLSH